MSSFLRLAALTLFLWLAHAGLSPVLAQSSALRGRVLDEQGNPVSNASVVLQTREAGVRLSAVSGADGSYAFEGLAGRDYIVEVEALGFARVIRRLTVGDPADITLRVDGVSDTVVVTAAGAPQTVDEVSKAVTVIDRQEILDRNEYALHEILRTAPGIQVLNNGGPGAFTQLRTRGLRPDATAILYDGLRFRDASTTQGDATSFMSNLNFVDFGRVEFLRGSGSSLYGTNAVGGVVNVVSSTGGGPTTGSLQLEGGGLGLFRGRFQLQGGLAQDRFAYSFATTHLNVTRGVNGWTPTRSTGVQGTLRYDFTPNISLTGRVNASDDFVALQIGPTTSGIPAANFPTTGVIPARFLPSDQVRRLMSGVPASQIVWGDTTVIPNRQDPDNRRTSDFAMGAVIFNHIINPVVSYRVAWQRVHTARVFQNGPGGFGFQPVTSNVLNYVGDIDTVDARVNLQPTRWLTFTAGYEFEREAYFDRQDNRLPDPRRRVDVQTNISQNAHAGYFQAQFRLLEDRLQLSLSGRTQGFRLNRPTFLATGTTNAYANVQLKAPPRAFTGDISASYLIPTSKTKVRAHVGNAYRAPALYERFGGGFFNNPVTGLVNFTPYGDPFLSPDRYNSFDGGVDQYFFRDRLQVGLTVFYTRVVQITAFDSSGVLNPATDPYGRSSGYINGSGGISRGVEVSFNARPTATLTLNGSYTHTSAGTDRDVSVRGFFRIFGVAAHTFTLVANQAIGKRFNVNFDMVAYSGTYASLFAVNRSRAFEVPGFVKADVMGGYTIPVGNDRSLRVYGKVENMFNRRYFTGNGWLAPGVVGTGGVAFQF
ncbi:MAG: TonB-dependent receptor [Chloracidobacterium sp.]